MTGIHHQHSHIRLVEYLIALSPLRLPSWPSSSMPGVSIIITGPRGSSSMALYTGSVVVPFTSDTTARSWPVTAFSTLDLPAFLLPKNQYVSGPMPAYCSFPWLSAPLSLVPCWFIAGSFPIHYQFNTGSLPVYFRFIACSLPVHCLFTSGLLPVHFRFITGSPPVSCRTDPLLKT